MDEPNDERTEPTEPSRQEFPWRAPETTAPLPPSPPLEPTAPVLLPEATVVSPQAPAVAAAPGTPEPGASHGEGSGQPVSNEHPWAVPSWEPNWSQGGQWVPVQASNPPGSYPPGSYPPASNPPGSYPPESYPPGVYGSAGYGTPGYGTPGYGTPGYGTPGYGPGGYGPGGYGPGGNGPSDHQPSGPERPSRGRKALVLAAVGLVLLGGAAGAGIAYAFRPNQGPSGALATSPTTGKSLTTSQVAAVVNPAVVDITTNLGEGTGMIATSNGEIITNNHVVEGATSIKVATLNHGTYTAKVVGTDAKADVAVLQLTGVSGLSTVKFGNSSDVQVGNTVVAIGNAQGQDVLPGTVTAGAVTALGRTITASDETGASETLTGMIQMNAQIQPGDSGGPLVDSSGEVIGMDTAAASSDGASSTSIGFALPINRVLQVANDIEQGKSGNGIVIGSVAFLGIAGETVKGGSGQVAGAGLEFVEPGSPADKAGIQQGDVIVAFNGHTVTTMPALANMIHQLRPGDSATVTFVNTSGGRKTVTVTLGAAPPA